MHLPKHFLCHSGLYGLSSFWSSFSSFLRSFSRVFSRRASFFAKAPRSSLYWPNIYAYPGTTTNPRVSTRTEDMPLLDEAKTALQICKPGRGFGGDGSFGMENLRIGATAIVYGAFVDDASVRRRRPVQNVFFVLNTKKLYCVPHQNTL